MTKRMSYEMFRRLRLGNMRALLLDRCGRVLPDDDAGLEYLQDLLIALSLGRDPKAGMMQAAKDWAPWAKGKYKVEEFIDTIIALPARERRLTAKQLGARWLVTNEERECLGLRTIFPMDMTDEQMAEQRKAKDRARKRKKRVPRDVWLAKNNISKQEPWKAEGISRKTWYKRRRKGVTGPSRVKDISTEHTCHLGTVDPRADKRRADALTGAIATAPFLSSSFFHSPLIVVAPPRRGGVPPPAEPQAKRTHLSPPAKRTNRVPAVQAPAKAPERERIA